MVEHNVNWTELRSLCQKLMMAEHVSEEDALVCADNLVDADLCGVESHGVSRMTNYMKRLRTGVVDSQGQCKVENECSGSLYVHGGNAMGMVVGKYTMERCIEKAKESGCCFAAASNSNHYGMAAYYARMAAEAGMIGITGTNAPPNLAPWGSPHRIWSSYFGESDYLGYGSQRGCHGKDHTGGEAWQVNSGRLGGN